MRKVSVVLFNLGGPSSLEGVKPFLFNLFFDKAIIPLPKPIRWILAKLVAGIREKKARRIYQQIGGSSPILEQTNIQAKALAERLNKFYDAQVVVAMRYTSPYSFEVMKEIENHNPEDIVLLPLYPHFSTATTNSSIEDFLKNLSKSLESIKKRVICCYPTEENFINSHKKLLGSFLEKHGNENLKLLISAHGLPKKIVNQGDPYIWQIEATAKEIMRDFQDVKWEITYQSRVGPVEWVKPATDEAIKGAALSGKNILILPISFVSEHSETLVELDIEYKNLAESLGVSNFYRLPTLQITDDFIKSLYTLCEATLLKNQTKLIEIYSQKEYRICPESYCKCVNKKYVN